ncbi:hypothetical protein ACOJBO_00600 [Rhizobium beringeri]
MDLEVTTALFQRFQNLQARRYNLRANSIRGDRCNLVFTHVFAPL